VHRELSNALRGHLAEYGIVAAQGMVQLKRLQEALETSPGLPQAVREIGRMYLEQIAVCTEKIATLERALRLEAARCAVTARLQTMPGVGPITAMAVEAFAPPMPSWTPLPTGFRQA
jgi:transposase